MLATRSFPMMLLATASCCEIGFAFQGYRNSDAPNCGTFHTGKIQGSVKNQAGAPVDNVNVVVFDDVSHRILSKTTTDGAGRFSLGQVWNGRLRVVFSSPGFRPDDWAVTMASPESVFAQKKMRVVLLLPL